MEKKKTWKKAAIGIIAVLIVLCIIWMFGVHNFEVQTADASYFDQDGITLSNMDMYDFTLGYDVVDLELYNLGSVVYKGDVTLTIENDIGEVFFTISPDELKAYDKLYVGALEKGNYKIVANCSEASFAATFWVTTYARGYQWIFR